MIGVYQNSLLSSEKYSQNQGFGVPKRPGEAHPCLFAAARIVSRTKRTEHITSKIFSLASVNYRIDVKVLLLVYESLNGLSP